jgi:probable F420-dependent oxidoreductase
MRFGVGLPTCREGTAYPTPYVQPSDFARIAHRAEALGFHSLWANDHLTTPRVMQATLDRPPRFYEPLVTFASLAGVTERLRFVLSVVVLPEREPVLLAKQIATLDELSGGRVVLGVGLGAYREEFEAVHPGLAGANRGAMLDEGIQALRRLFDDAPPVSFEGRYLAFRDIELAPRPRQQPFPVYVNADSDVGFDRVARLGDGWIASAPTPAGLVEARAALAQHVTAAGRDPAAISVNVQIWASLGRDRSEAEARLRRSQHLRRLLAARPSRDEQVMVDEFAARNLLGGPDEVRAHLHALEHAGADHVGLIFLGQTVDELLADLDLFGERVLPDFPS